MTNILGRGRCFRGLTCCNRMPFPDMFMKITRLQNISRTFFWKVENMMHLHVEFVEKMDLIMTLVHFL